MPRPQLFEFNDKKLQKNDHKCILRRPKLVVITGFKNAQIPMRILSVMLDSLMEIFELRKKSSIGKNV